MSRFDDQFADDSGISCFFTLGSITLPNKKIKSINYHIWCVGRLINILLIFCCDIYMDRNIQYHENRTFLFCLSIHIPGISTWTQFKDYRQIVFLNVFGNAIGCSVLLCSAIYAVNSLPTSVVI